MDYTQFKLDTDDVLWNIRQRCMREMYKRAQPSADYDEIFEGYKKAKKEGRQPEKVYDRYYLSQEEFSYILNKYKEKYRLIDSFKDDCDIIIRDIKDGCIKNKYIPEKIDPDGFKHPGYRSYEDVPPLKNIIGEEHANIIIKFIEDRKNFYNFNSAENKFSFSVALQDSPTCNPDTVIKYWEEQGVHIEIDPRHLTDDQFWCEEHGYEDEE